MNEANSQPPSRGNLLDLIVKRVLRATRLLLDELGLLEYGASVVVGLVLESGVIWDAVTNQYNEVGSGIRSGRPRHVTQTMRGILLSGGVAFVIGILYLVARRSRDWRRRTKER